MPDLGKLNWRTGISQNTKFWIHLSNTKGPYPADLPVTFAIRPQNFEDEKFFRHENLVYHVTAELPGILKSIFLHLEVPGNLSSWPFFSDPGPNSTPNPTDNFGVDLPEKTSSTQKLDTPRTGRMPRVPTPSLATKGSLEKSGKKRFRTPNNPTIRTLPAMALKTKSQNQRKIGVPWQDPEIPRWWTTAAKPRKSGTHQGKSKIWKST